MMGGMMWGMGPSGRLVAVQTALGLCMRGGGATSCAADGSADTGPRPDTRHE